MAKKESAEDKLMKIIEATKKKQEVATGGSAGLPVPKKTVRVLVTTRQINVVLFVFALASFFFVVYEINNGRNLLQQEVSVEDVSAVPADASDILVPQVRSLTYYLEQISKRNIFKPYEKPVAGADSVTSAQAVLQQKISKYKIVGIAWLDVPESATVMMENSSTHMTHFLKVGEKIEDVAVKTIYTDRVVFSYANEEIVIKL